MSLRFLSAGESHGPLLSAILEGMPAGLSIDIDEINHELSRRQRGFGSGGRMKIEKDRIQISGGVMGGETTGGPISIMIKNMDHKNWKGKSIKAMTIPRPGHADLAGAVKYGYFDLRLTLERASARETAIRVGIGAICKQFLNRFGIRVGGYVREIGGITAKIEEDDSQKLFEAAEKSEVRCPDPSAAEAIRRKIAECIDKGDTLGGVIEAAVLNVPAGLGSYVQADRRLDARLAGSIVSIPGIKGLEIGDAFDNTRQSGIEASDEISLKKKQIIRKTNLAGGIEGGISNGMPIKLRAAMKPIATTLNPKKTVDLATGNESQTSYERSDFCPVPRAVPIVEAVTALIIADALIEKLGGDSMAEMIPRFKSLRQSSLDNLKMDSQDKVWWE